MSDTEEKKHKASAQKLRKSRQDGSVPSIGLMVGFFGTFAGILALTAMATFIWLTLSINFANLEQIISMPFDLAVSQVYLTFGRTVVFSVFPVIAASAILSFLLTLVMNGGFVFSMKPVAPQLDRISPLAGFKRIFGMRGWLEFLFGTIRLLTWVSGCVLLGLIWLPTLFVGTECSEFCYLSIALPLIWGLAIGAICTLIVFGAADALIQRFLFMDEQRMTDTEVKNERKGQFGSAEVRRERNRLQNEAREEDPVKKGIGQTTIAFFTKDMAIGINFEPPESKLPRVVAKARGEAEVLAFKEEVAMMRRPLAMHAGITRSGIGKELGRPIDPEYFEDFVKQIVIHFERKPKQA